MPTIKAGVDRKLISPEKGIYLIGFADRERGAESVHDDLTATTLVLDDGNQKLVIIALDLLLIHRDTVTLVRKGIADKLGMPEKNILLCCSHTHSGPVAWAPPQINLAERLREIKNRICALPAAFEQLTVPDADAKKDQDDKGNETGILEYARNIMRIVLHLPGQLVNPKGIKANRKYLDNLIATLVDSAVTASGNMEESVITHGRGTTDVGINRRERMPDGRIELGYHHEGPVDPDVEVLQIKRGDTPLVTLVNHACHLTILGPNSNVVSADMAGVMRAKVERELGGLCMFIQGASGNINPNVGWSDDNMPDVQRFGGKFADAVLEVTKDMQEISPAPIKCAEDVVDVHLDVPESMEDLPAQEIVSRTINRIFGVPMFLINPILSIRFPWEAKVNRNPDGFTTPIHVGAVRFGDIAVSWIGMETFVEIGHAVKAASSAPVTLFAGYTNGHNGYLPTADEAKLGGYEIEWAPYMLRLPGTLRADSEAKVADRLRSLLDEVAPQSE